MTSEQKSNSASFKKTVCPGIISLPSRGRTSEMRTSPVIYTIDFDGKRLSITFTEGPMSDGDCLGSCGCGYSREPIVRFAPGWDQGALDRLVDATQWRLNDMRAGCAHQRKEWKDALLQEIEIVTYRLTTEAFIEQREVTRIATDRLAKGDTVTLDAHDQALLALPLMTTAAPDSEGPGSGRYEVRERQVRIAGHVRPDEHPRGLLCKPCEVCGYKYGSQWLHEDVPDGVLEFLRSLPDV